MRCVVAVQYTRRIIDGMLDGLLAELAAIAIDGAKAVGKTAMAGERAASTLALSEIPPSAGRQSRPCHAAARTRADR